MSTSGPRYHIPFPSNFLSLNTPSHKKISLASSDVVISPSEISHSFLSNRPAAVPRHSSVSSVDSISSESTAGSAPSSPPTFATASPIVGQKTPAFLALNSKHAAPPTTIKEMKATLPGGFLSNRH